MYIELYVDDLLVGCESDSQATENKLILSNHFEIKDLGDVQLVLGIEVYNNRECVLLQICQSQFIDRLAERFDQNSAFPERNSDVFIRT